MPFETSHLIADLTTVVVLFFLFLLFHSKLKKQSVKESWAEIKDGLKGSLGLSEDEA